MIAKEEFGKRLRERRRAAGLTQAQLASGQLSTSYISRLEAGKRSPSQPVIQAIASRLGCTAAELRAGTGPDDEAAESLAFAQLALTHGEAGAAREHLDQIMASGRLHAAQRDEALVLLAQAHELTDDPGAAVEILSRLVHRIIDGDSIQPLPEVGTNLVRCHLRGGDTGAALRDGEAILSALAPADRASDAGVRLATTVQGVHMNLGNLLLAAVMAHVLGQFADRTATALGQGSVRWNAAVTADLRGRVCEAIELASSARALLAQAGKARDLARATTALAWFLLRGGTKNANLAADLLDQVLPVIEDFEAPAGLAIWRFHRSYAHLLQGEAADAERVARQALLELNRFPGEETIRTLIILGDALFAQERWSEAQAQYRGAQALLDGLASTRAFAELAREAGDRLAATGRSHAAVPSYRLALTALGIPEGSLPSPEPTVRRDALMTPQSAVH